MYPDEVKDACNKQLHSQVRREARRAWQLQNISTPRSVFLPIGAIPIRLIGYSVGR